jgi:hypothetical protein
MAAEIGYIYTFVISAMLLGSLTYITSNMIDASVNEAANLEMENVAKRVSTGIQDAIRVAEAHPRATYSKTIELKTKIYGLNYFVEVFQEGYTITIWVNGTEAFNPQEGKPTARAETFQTSVEIRGNVYHMGSLTPHFAKIASTSGRIKVIYNGFANHGDIVLTE